MIATHLTYSISPPQVCPLCFLPPTHRAHSGFKGRTRRVEGPYVLDLTQIVIICPLKCGRWPNTGCLSPGAFLWGSWKPHWAQPTLIPCLAPLTPCRSGPLPSARFIPGGLLRQRYELPTALFTAPSKCKAWQELGKNLENTWSRYTSQILSDYYKNLNTQKLHAVYKKPTLIIDIILGKRN